MAQVSLVKNATFIYTVKEGDTFAFNFGASSEDDLKEKGRFLAETTVGITGSIFGWINDPDLDYYRKYVKSTQ